MILQLSVHVHGELQYFINKAAKGRPREPKRVTTFGMHESLQFRILSKDPAKVADLIPTQYDPFGQSSS